MNRRTFLAGLFAAIGAKCLPPSTTLGTVEPSGITITFASRFGIPPDFRVISRMDLLYGCAPVIPEMAVRYLGPPAFFDPHLDPKRLPL